MNEYKNVRIALRNFIVAQMSARFNGSTVYRSAPKPTDVTQYPACIIRTATVEKVPLNDDGPTMNLFNMEVVFLTRGPTTEVATDELDDILQEFDNIVSSVWIRGLDAALATGGSAWHDMYRLRQRTEFDQPTEDQTGWVIHSVLAGLRIVEGTPILRG